MLKPSKSSNKFMISCSTPRIQIYWPLTHVFVYSPWTIDDFALAFCETQKIAQNANALHCKTAGGLDDG
uniref:Uncharacterized protein n=1 Tax=Caenorhabditis japonica TaxID=281687 RepID=A0A8R1IKU1_CAEJA